MTSVYGRFHSRINRELDVLRGSYMLYVHENTDPDEKSLIMDVIVIDGKNRYFKIKLNRDYPFRPPPLMYMRKDIKDEKEYVMCIRDLVSFYQTRLNLVSHPTVCICCNNLTCNWSPGCRMADILYEQRNFESWFKDLRSGYFGIRALEQKKNLYKDVIVHISQYIYSDDPAYPTIV
jgi:hypothetical protein